MYKVVGMLRRQPHLSHEQFVAHYENWHAPWGYRNFCSGHVRRYRRNYITPIEGLNAPQFDVINEFWFDDEADFWRWREAKADHPLVAELTADEDSFFDRTATLIFTIDTVEGVRPIPDQRPEPGQS